MRGASGKTPRIGAQRGAAAAKPPRCITGLRSVARHERTVRNPLTRKLPVFTPNQRAPANFPPKRLQTSLKSGAQAAVSRSGDPERESTRGALSRGRAFSLSRKRFGIVHSRPRQIKKNKLRPEPMQEREKCSSRFAAAGKKGNRCNLNFCRGWFSFRSETLGRCAI